MHSFSPHLWPDSAAEAIALQHALRHQVSTQDDFGPLETIAGVDCSYDLQRDLSRAVIVLMDYRTLEVIRSVQAFAPTLFPYIPGLLSFREIPVILEALAALQARPDLLMVDGQGIAHPRRLGVASHLGVLTGIPAIGVAKSLLTGKFAEPGSKKGDQSLLLDKGERIGTVLRSREDCKPLFISPGHKVSQETAVSETMRCLTRYRLPEPTRIADKMSKWVAGRDVPQPAIASDVGTMIEQMMF